MNALEARIRRRLDESSPCCTLSGVTLYRPDRFGSGDPFGYEIDNMLHWQSGADDRIVIFECKDAPIRIAATTSGIPPQNQEWYAPINGGTARNLKDQLFNQAESIWQNLCIPPNPRRRIDAFVVTSLSLARLKCSLYSESGLTLHVVSEMELVELLRNSAALATVLDTEPGGRFLRVAQSDLLRMARQSVIVPELGHPEIDHAIEMIRRCRQTLDGRLFDFFKPKERRWAINGSAGMGKTVLLAYAATVFSTGRTMREIQRDRNDRTPRKTELTPHEDAGLKLPALDNRRIAVIGLKARQLEVLHDMWQRFFNWFKQLAGHYLPVSQPEFARWSGALDLSRYNIICLDEAHDLAISDQGRLAAWWTEKPADRYLVIACDRHQRLRFSAEEQERWMIKGVPFSGCSTRLSRNYRSPTAVYCAGLALMFRWFAPNGPKVVPEKSHLEESFGFTVRLADRRIRGRIALSLINDAHPANHWRFTVSRFTHTDAAFAWLQTNNLKQEDVLWVRFAEECPEAEHDSEHIRTRFNYKGLNSFSPQTTIDAEIKGRDFPVVVIEGMPRGMAALPVTDEVWSLRRQVYLCASRATAFLFFIIGPGDASPETNAIHAEIDSMLAALEGPEDPDQASTKKWSFEFALPEAPVGMDVFVDDEEFAGQERPEEEVRQPTSISVVAPVSKPISAEKPQATQQSEQPVGKVPATEPQAPPSGGNGNSGGHPELARHEQSQPKPAQAETSAAASDATTPKNAVKADAAPLLSEKDFQRRYGHIKNWKKELYQRYCDTGQLPTYVSPKSTNFRPAPRVPPARGGSVPYLTVQQLAQFLDVKTFKLIAALKDRSGTFVSPDQVVLRWQMDFICRKFGRPVPTDAQLVQLAAIPSSQSH